MPLQDQIINISLVKGLNTKTDPKQVLVGDLETLENGVFITPGEIRKRDGYNALSTSIMNVNNFNIHLTSGNSIGNFNNSLTLLDNTSFYSYSATYQKWVNKGNLITNSFSSSAIGINAISVASPQMAVFNNIGFVTWQNATDDPSQLFSYAYVDLNNDNEVILSNFNGFATVLGNVIPFYAGFGPQGNIFTTLVETRNGASSAIEFFHTSADNPGSFISSTSVVPLSSSTSAVIDAVISPSNIVYIICDDASGGVRIVKADPIANTILASQNPVVGTNPIANAIYYDTTNNYVWCAWDDGTNFTVAIFDSDLNVVQNPTNICSSLTSVQITLIQFNSTSVAIYVEQSGAPLGPSFNIVYKIIYNRGDSSESPSIFQNSASLVGKAFQYSNNTYVPCLHSSPQQATCFLIEDTTPTLSAGTPSIVTKYSRYTAGGLPKGLSSFINLSTNNYCIPYLMQVDTSVTGGTITSLYNVNLLNLTFGSKLRNVALAQNLNITGGQCNLYDGNVVTEVGFNLFPEDATGTFLSTGGSLSAGKYSWVAIYRWVDGQGNVHRSAPAPNPAITNTYSASGGQATIDVPILYLTNKKNIFIDIFRTTANGSVFYKVATLSGSTTSYTDTTADSDIQGNEQLYTTGGEVENIAPPAMTAICAYKNRIIGVPSGNPYTWWYSKQVIQGFPVEFSDLFVQSIDQKGGIITALSTMDDKLIFFKEYLIFYVIGDGPAPNGSNNDFSYPQIISTDVGCINQDSILLTPMGLMFKSHKGIYLLGRDLSTSYIGASVEAYNSHTIESASLVPNTTQARFVLDDGTILMFDYFINAWGVFTGLNAIDSLIYNNQYTLLKANGTVLLETDGVYTDNGAAIDLNIKTGWLEVAQLQGFQRVKQLLILGESESNTQLNVSLAYNYNPTIVQTDNITITSAQIPMQYRVFPQIQKCESMQITLSDSPATPLGEGVRISGLAFTVGIKKGAWKLPAAQSFG